MSRTCAATAAARCWLRVLTSTGFGEITPVTDMARSLIVIEQVLGVMYVAS